MEENSLAYLVCGNYNQHPSVYDLYDVLFHNISHLENKLRNLLENEDSDKLTDLGPYYARKILELTCSALIGRIDPFRLIYVHKVQSLNFEIGSKAKASISWSGDVFVKNDLDSSKMWKQDKDFSQVGRGLFGNHYSEIFWTPAFERLIDDSEYLLERSLEYFRTNIESPEKFMLYIRPKSSNIYSALSKGVHSELLIRPEIIYDATTVKERIKETLEICSILGIVSHYMDLSINRLPIENAFQHYKKIFEWRENYE